MILKRKHWYFKLKIGAIISNRFCPGIYKVTVVRKDITINKNLLPFDFVAINIKNSNCMRFCINIKNSINFHFYDTEEEAIYIFK